ncbi:hypothetical protein Taro_026880 [Colocasia esculenta]|uniref:WRKY domain-containing protein n=1 Tax=Colocasia esculenta TaxID=4460 RepID=A0A843VD31_COLES|nr:hypothetical protein [Colocasia esculenta]
MEAMLRRSPGVAEERRAHCAGGEEDADDRITTINSIDMKQDLASTAYERSPSHALAMPSNSCPRDPKVIKQDAQLEWTRAEMGEVKQENERLKTTLAKIMKDYQSLQMHYFDIIKQDQDRRPVPENPNTHQRTDESELVSLSLGTSSGGHKKEEKAAAMGGNACKVDQDEQMKGVLSLGLDCRFDIGSCSDPSETQANASSESSLEETKEADAPGKVLKRMRSEERGDASELLSPVKRARMNDGCQWRKYGQKISKGNPCPRAYYRCTVAPSCPVRKQVQRCAEDMSILITTYEGTHNHPLSISATAMASTTSAAASMLMSGSTASQPVTGVAGDYAAASGIAGLHHGLNFGLSDLSRQRQFYPSMISSSASCPTITLDLTAPPSSSSPAAQFSRLSSGYPPKRFTFSTSQPSNAATSQTPWSTSAGYLNYATHPYNTKSHINVFSNLDRSPQLEPLYSSLMQKATQPAPLAGTHGSLTDTAIAAAAAKVITSDPSFQSALASAITSIVGGNGGSQGVAEQLRRINPRWEEKQVSTLSLLAPSSNGNGCASSFLTRSTSSSRSDSQQASALMFLQPSLAFPSSKSTSASPRDHAN